MKRTKIQIPDVINHTIRDEYTRIPNELLRNPNITAKAKALLCLLLSNQKGWHSYMTTLSAMMKEGKDAIRSGISELEMHGYLARVKYREIESKKMRGTFWIYTDKPNVFHALDDTRQMLLKNGFEAMFSDQIRSSSDFEPQPGFPALEKPASGKPAPKKNNNKNNKIKNNNKAIQKTEFENFWKSYPNKASKGKALSAWLNLCSKPINNRPTLEKLLQSIEDQKKTRQWQNPKYIPHASTWLNNHRWLDDPNLMGGGYDTKPSPAAYRDKNLNYQVTEI